MSFPDNPYQSPKPPPPGQLSYAPPNPGQNAQILAVLSLVVGGLGLLSVCPCFGCFFMWMPPLAIVMGVIALALNPDRPAKTMAIAGISCGGLAVVLWIAYFTVMMVTSAMQDASRVAP